MQPFTSSDKLSKYQTHIDIQLFCSIFLTENFNSSSRIQDEKKEQKRKWEKNFVRHRTTVNDDRRFDLNKIK